MRISPAAFASLSVFLAACASAPPPPPEEPAPPVARASAPASEPASASPSASSSAPATEPHPSPSTAAEPSKAQSDPPSPSAKTSRQGSSLSASSMTVDGTSFSSLECDLGGRGGLLGPIAIAKGVSLQKSALDACTKKATETPIEVTSAGGTFTKVKANGPDATVNRCVEKALKGKQAAIPGTCAMTVQHGR